MITVIGNSGCSKCEVTKTILKSKNVDFEYKLLKDLPKDEKEKYLNMAKEAKQLSLPIIIMNDKVVTLQEVEDVIK